MSNASPRLEDPGVLELRRKREEFERRVRENERLAAANPLGYRKRLKALVGVGYAFIGLMVLLALALVAGILFAMLTGGHIYSGEIKLIIAGLALLYAIVRSLWVKIDRPEGFRLTRERFPRLWQEVEAVADQLKAPRPDEILLDEEFNASATQWPRFGIFGGYRHVLTLGLPLLAGFSPDEAKGVIAHEFGHFSGSHGRFGVWIYRVNQTWSQLAQNLGSSGYAGFLFRPFMNWFFPRFMATSFAIRRQHEYEADAAAAEVVGPKTYAETLARLGPLGDHLEKAFWVGYRQESTRLGAMAPAFSSRMVASMRDSLDLTSAQRRLDFALAQPTDYDDTHPSLTDRLRSIGQSIPSVPSGQPGPSAAEALFGADLPALEKEFDVYYQRQMTKLWDNLAQQKAKRVARLEELGRRPADSLSDDEQVERAFLQVELDPSADAVATYRELVARLPENANAQYHLGSALIEREDEEGAALLESVAERMPKWRDAIRRELAAFYAAQGEVQRVTELREEARDAHDRARVAQSNASLTLGDELLPPEITPEERQRLTELLGQLKGLGKAHLFQKRMPATGELRHYLVLVPKPTALMPEEPLPYFSKQLKKLSQPPIRLTVATVPKSKPWRERLESIPNALVFDVKA